jgi:2'-5' RNA ligase
MPIINKTGIIKTASTRMPAVWRNNFSIENSGVLHMITFIAIELDGRLKNEIYSYVKKNVMPYCKKGRWVSKDNYHITLKYLGETREQEISRLFDALDRISGRLGPFSLSTGALGVFGGQNNCSRARVLWLDVKGDVAALTKLKDGIERETTTLGHSRDGRFSPHITLARDVVFSRELDLFESLASLDMEVRSISLMESKLQKGRRVYTPLSVHRFR